MATELKGKIKVGKVDATVEKKVAERFKVSGYPTIKFFPKNSKNDDSAVDYSGAREKSAMVSYAEEEINKTKPTMFT